ncbi:cob(I)yrinic acid a,c-diamide adenosyltransferase [bacterium]|nr:cob(I)yrinic acid a,c-diamide adenosyltransferase [bacterium]
MKNKKGYTHIYTGNGKGKTTAALGLAVRAVGAGKRVCFIQFLKGGIYSEHRVLKQIKGITLKKFGRDCLVGKKAVEADYVETEKALAAVTTALFSGRYDLVIADEILVAVSMALIAESDVKKCMQARPQAVELVLTGRNASPGLKRMADLVTEMKEGKHYYQKGVMARRGIEY